MHCSACSALGVATTTPSGSHESNSSNEPTICAYGADGYRRIALVGVGDIESAPVPQLHIHLPRTILMIAANDQPAVFTRQLGGEIERPLLADRLDHSVAEFPAGQFPHSLDDCR